MPVSAEAKAIVARYLELREASRRVNEQLVESRSKEDMYAGARNLGMLRGNAIYFDSENMESVLMDYCIHDVRRDGLNAVERMARDAPPPWGGIDEAILNAKLHARHSVFLVESREPDVGVTCSDLIQ